MKIAIIGAGLIGCERIEAIQYICKNIDDSVSISAVCDPNATTLEKIKTKYNVPVVSNMKDALLTQPDWVFVCVPHDVAPSIIKAAFDIGANVLAEKPLGRSLKECQNIVDHKPSHCKLCVGFNYRFYDGISN